MRYRVLIPSITVWMVFVAVIFSGCEEQVDPILGVDEAFSFYGYFNPRADTQAIRVYSIDGILKPESGQKLDAVVTSKNKESGQSVTWRDSTVVFHDGTVGHVFYALFRPSHGARYVFQAERSDGKKTYADLQMPEDGQAELVSISSTRSSVIAQINWTNVPRMLQFASTYTVKVPFPDRSDTTTVRVRIPSGRPEQLNSGAWKVTILPSSDIGFVLSALGLRPGIDLLFLEEIEVNAFVVSADWVSPVGEYDAELLVQPGTFDNVEDGFGFIGSGYTDQFIFTLTDKQKQDAGFSLK